MRTHMCLQEDEEGLVSLPLKLLVISVVATMSIIPAADALESMHYKEFVSRCSAQLQGIIRTCQLLSVEGPGAARGVTLDLRSQGTPGMACLSIGGGYGRPGMCSAVLELSNGNRIIATAEQPSVWICSEELEVLLVYSCLLELRFECTIVPGGVCVTVKVA